MEHNEIDLDTISEGGVITVGKEYDTGAVVISAPTPQREITVQPTVAKPINLDHLAGGTKQLITLDLTNTTGLPLDMFIGTPRAIPDETVGVGGTLVGLFNGAAGATDRFGAGTPFLVGVSERIVRNPIIVSRIEILTDGDVAGLNQRSERVTKINVNYNADPCERAGLFLKFFQENNYVVAEQLVVLSEQWGIQQTINTLQNVRYDITIEGLPVYNYSNSKSGCM